MLLWGVFVEIRVQGGEDRHGSGGGSAFGTTTRLLRVITSIMSITSNVPKYLTGM